MKKLSALVALLALSLCFVFAACKPGIADNTEHFDSITKTLKLNKDYEGKNLMSSDGIGVATLIGDTTDGDTTAFRLLEGSTKTVRVRYQGVDTPESTASYEKWGKAASKFTNERLHEATLIVLESASGGVPETDSVGQRSLCYVWYKTEKSGFKCLNLELVENGFSTNKESAKSSYYSYFQKAESFAQGIQLRIYSKLEDPLFDNVTKDVTLKDFAEHRENFYDGMKIRITAFVLDASTSSTTTFTVGQYDEETGKVYTVSLYAGYSSASASKMQVGNLYLIVGWLQERDDGWQLSGVDYDDWRQGKENITWTKQSAYYLVFNNSVSKASYNCYGDVTVTSVSPLEGKTLTFVGQAQNSESETETFTFKVTVPEDYVDGTIAKGTKLSVSGCYQFTANSGELTIVDYSDITVK